MSIVFRAEDVPARSRVDYWRHVAGETIVPLDLRIPGAPDFRSRVRTGDVGAVRVTEVMAPTAELWRTAKLIRRSDPGLYKIDVVAGGHMAVDQDRRQACLGPGDFTLVDLSRPGHWANSPVRLVSVLFPRALLPLRQDEVARLTAVRIPGDQGTAALVSSLTCQLPRHLDDHGAADGARLGTAVLDMLAVALAARLDRESELPDGNRQRTLLLHIHAYIEQRLADPDLSPGMIAAAHYISVRYLHRLFETQQTSVASWIRRRRLDRCRRDLLDPALQARPLSATAARWGFASAVQFSRAFRAAYGVPPGEYRLRNHGSRPR
jgi:AraC-like DNA-binding protein